MAGSAQALPLWTCVGFTGHREIEDPSTVTAAIATELQRLQRRQVAVAVVSSVASGADTLFAEAAARLDLPHHVILPFAPARFELDFEPDDWRRVAPLLERAIDIQIVGETTTSEEAYMEAGVRTVDRCDVLIAVLDDARDVGPGGTRDAVEYARALGKPLILIDPRSGAAAHERFDGLPAPSAVDPDVEPRAAVEAHFAHLDELASREGPKARWMILQIILLHLFAAAVAVAALALHAEGAWAKAAGAAKLVALVWAAVATWRLAHAHHGWMQSRIEAELCRSFLAIWSLPRRATPLPRVIPAGCSGLCRSLEMAWRLDPGAESRDLSGARDRYVADRVKSQRAYYLGRRRGPRWGNAAARIAVQVFVVAAILCAIVALLPAQGAGVDVAKLLSILLPLANTAILALVVTLDLGRRASRYREMAARLEETERRLEHVRTWQSLGRVAAQTEALLMEEISEWHALLRFGSKH